MDRPYSYTFTNYRSVVEEEKEEQDEEGGGGGEGGRRRRRTRRGSHSGGKGGLEWVRVVAGENDVVDGGWAYVGRLISLTKMAYNNVHVV